MKVHPLRIQFNVTKEIERYVYVYIIEAKHIYLIDTIRPGIAAIQN